MLQGGGIVGWRIVCCACVVILIDQCSEQSTASGTRLITQGLDLPPLRQALREQEPQGLSLPLPLACQQPRRKHSRILVRGLQNALRTLPLQRPLCQTHSRTNSRTHLHRLPRLARTHPRAQVTQRLVRLKKTGLLREGEEHNADLLAEAKKKYQQRFGKPVEQTVYSNDLEAKLPKSINRAELSAYIQSHYEEFKEIKKQAYDYSRDRKTIDDPEIMPL